MTEKQGKIIRDLKAKHDLQENSVPYILMLLGVGYDMSMDDIEEYLFHSENESMVEKDIRRVCMFLGIRLPDIFPAEKNSMFFLKKAISDWKKADEEAKSYKQEVKKQKEERKMLEEELNGYRLFFQRQDISFTDVAENEKARIVLEDKPEVPEGDGSLYGRLLSVMLQNKDFDKSQLDVITKAVKLGIPEEDILCFAKPSLSGVKMETCIEFWQLQHQQKTKTGFFEKFGKRKEKEV